MNHTLKNKRALITGGSRGIGAAIVKRLASVGADVALTYTSSPDQANEIVQAAQALGVRALAIQADSAEASAVIASVEHTVDKLGGSRQLMSETTIFGAHESIINTHSLTANTETISESREDISSSSRAKSNLLKREM